MNAQLYLVLSNKSSTHHLASLTVRKTRLERFLLVTGVLLFVKSGLDTFAERLSIAINL